MFSAAPASFSVMLPNRNAAPGQIVYDESVSYEENILRLLAEKQSVSRKEIEEFLHCSACPVIHALNAMLTEGKVVKVGRARSTRYALKS